VPEPKEASENRTEADRYDEKKARLRDANERNQNKTKDNKQSDRVPGPLTSANGTERHNDRVRLPRSKRLRSPQTAQTGIRIPVHTAQYTPWVNSSEQCDSRAVSV